MSRSPLLSPIVLLSAALLLSACNPSADRPAADAPTSESPGTTPDAAAHAFSPEINEADFRQRVQTLSSDAFEGRAPGSAGETRTIEYLKAQFELIGLQPGNGDSFFQTVPMVETTASPDTVLRLEVNGKPRELAFGSDMVIGTTSGKPQVTLDRSQMVFVGYGVNAPELGWNDYAGIDVKGKTVVMLVNDPGFHVDDATLFEGKRMTIYGRWTYKFEEAARQGAAAALIIHDDAGASYGWDVVKNSWSGAQFDLRSQDDPAPRLPAQGWISTQVATRLLGDAGQDLKALYQAANRRGFKAVALPATLSLDLQSTIVQKTSQNVLAVLPGSTRADEAIVYMAHWDHLGNHAGEGDTAAAANTDKAADTIYNGAIDNASGVAGILEIAEKFAGQAVKPERSLLFLAVTLEESGLLGSKYYVANPTIPLAKTVAAINLDAMSMGGKSRDMTVVGMGSSQLEDVLKRIADGQGRTLGAEGSPQSGFYFRSDHFNFAKAGVPALYAKGGDDLLEGGLQAGQKAQLDYRDIKYHKPADEYDPAWKLGGVIQDLEALYRVGAELAGGGQWPNWYDASPFRAARDKLRPPGADASPPTAAPTTTP